MNARWPGVDPSWSRFLDVPSSSSVDPAGTVHRWHVLDNGPDLARRGLDPVGTLLCVHGNPTWSYLWRTLLAAGLEAAQPWRVVAVDQLDMGFSARTQRMRRLADRVSDLGDLTAALGLTGPVVTVGHDWGGVISLGWAVAHPGLLAGVVLTNTAVHQPEGEPIPAPLRLALHPAVHHWGTTTSQAFLRVTHSLAHPPLQPDVRQAFLAPYRSAASRAGVGNFVADIPADPSHPSHATLRQLAEGVRSLRVPALMLWGPRDPIFSDRYLRDLIGRLPQAQVHRFEGAGHLLPEDVDVASPIFRWLSRLETATQPPESSATEGNPASFTPLWSELEVLAEGERSGQLAVAEMAADGGTSRTLTWAQLRARVLRLATALRSIGVRRGSRVSLMVPPGIDLTVLIYACLRIGAVLVVADAGLGRRGLSRAVKGAGPDFLVGVDRALLGARLFGWPGQRISIEELPAPQRRLLGVEHSVAGLLREAAAGPVDEPGPKQPQEPVPADADAAVLFTSGSTGPAKGVVYTQAQLAAMRDTVASTFGIGPGSRLVAGFAPFALLGPALGAASVTPAMDVTAPGTLTAAALADSAAAIEATVVFASPAALRNVLATASPLREGQREALAKVSLVLSAGAPVGTKLLEDLQALLPAASLHTPYGMTEALPVTDIDLGRIHEAEADAAAGTMTGAGNGVCVGVAVHGAAVAISPLDSCGNATGAPSTSPGITGEILVSAPHVKQRYDRLWLTQEDSARDAGWHRTGDVGHFDAAGRLWVEGRLVHLLSAPSGVLTPVGVEQVLESVEGVRLAALVGVGPPGTQAAVAVVETVPPARKPALADAALSARLRSAARAAGVELSAVLAVPALPTDIRHNAKIDRTRLAHWAAAVLAGGRMGRP